MGRPKLLLPWNEWTLMDQVLSSWTASSVEQVVVVLRDDDEPLQTACRRWPVHQVKVERTPEDMKESVSFGMQFLNTHWQPADDDRCFVAPADLPGITPDIIDRILEESPSSSSIAVPHFGDRQGHPVLLPWAILQHIHGLHDDQGVNSLVNAHPQHIVQFAAEDYFGDVDTPGEYERLHRKQGGRSAES